MAHGAARALALLAIAAGAAHPIADAQARRSDLLRVERQRAEAADEAQRLQREERAARREIAALTAQLVAAGERRAEAERAAQEAETRLAELKLRQAIDTRTYAADRDTLEALVIAGAFAQRRSGRAAMEASVFSRAAARDVLGRIGLTSRALEDARRLEMDIAIEQANLAAAQVEIDAERAHTQAVLAQQRALRTSLQADMERAQQRAARLAREARSLRELAERATASATPRAGAPRAGSVPTSWTAPATGRIVQGYGVRSAGGPATQGVTMRIRPGGQVVAPTSGEIAYAGAFRGYGNVLILNVPGGYALVLTGMESLRVRAGEAVAAGQPVGEMPATADATDTPAPELYVEVRRDGRPIDPSRWLAARGVTVAQAD